MPARRKRVSIAPSAHNAEQEEWRDALPSSEQVERRAREHFEVLVAFAKRDVPAGRTFLDLERELVKLVFTLGRLLMALLLCRRHEEIDLPASEVVEGKRFSRAHAQSREVGTFFGKVRYWRTYMRGQRGGYYPLDRLLKLPAEGFSLHLLSLVTRVATKISYAQSRLLVRSFLGWSPSVTSIERAVLGLGKSTSAWFEHVPPPEDDGDVLVIMIDSKATPTATQGELRKRRGKRRRKKGRSPRHRGRARRKNWRPKKRRKKGDHSKNGKAATLVVMYTLRSAELPGGRQRLEGPVNRRVYASYAPKRHAFVIARRDANKRGFTKDSGKRIQIVIDGDRCLAEYARDLFPEAILTLDVIHAVEYLWKAGRSFHREGSKALAEWVARQKDRLYAGQTKALLRELREALDRYPKTGPGNKGRRARLESALGYLEARVELMNYGQLLDQDLEISSGPVEGAVRYVIGQRFDAAGMRWITERSEALLQLRCIEINGHWDDFIRYVEARATKDLAVLAAKPRALPKLGIKRSAA